jgi:SAM-dependent methyltransferase
VPAQEPAPHLPPGVELPLDRRHPAPCPACADVGGRIVYTLRGIPVHSNVLCATREEALAYPTGDLDLVACEGCGLLFNPRHDPRLADYGPGYEETQGFSPTFLAWMEELVIDLAARHALAGGRVLEIGCGKGEFLERLAARADCRGLGYDPTLRSDRTRGSERVEFVARAWGAEDRGLEVDLVCCRHTLEHVREVSEFVALLRANLEGSSTPVFFEVPDALRILEEGAFWDVYFEHACYFTRGSLARLFRAASFEIEELGLAYAGQYVLLHARPAPAATTARLPEENDLATILAAVERFRLSVGASLAHCHAYLSSASADGKDPVVWGSGSKGVGFLTTLGSSADIGRVVDVNPHKHGKFMAGTGQEIVSPESLRDAPPARVIVMNPIYVEEIRGMLLGMGLEPGVVAV